MQINVYCYVGLRVLHLIMLHVIDWDPLCAETSVAETAPRRNGGAEMASPNFHAPKINAINDPTRWRLGLLLTN